jgi:hypothetical protein
VVVRADRLESHREQVIHREHAGRRLPAPVAEGLDGPHPAPGKVLGHGLDQHPADTAARELAEQVSGHEQYRVGAYRAGGEGDRAGHVLGRREKHVPGGHPVDIGDLAAAAPLEQHGRDPGLLLEFRIAAFLGPRPADRVKFPENAFPALRRQVTEIIQRDVDDTT